MEESDDLVKLVVGKNLNYVVISSTRFVQNVAICPETTKHCLSALAAERTWQFSRSLK